MSDDLIDHYKKSGLVPENPTRYFRRCDRCEERFDADDLNTIDVEKHGYHTTLEICDDCMPDYTVKDSAKREWGSGLFSHCSYHDSPYELKYGCGLCNVHDGPNSLRKIKPILPNDQADS